MLEEDGACRTGSDIPAATTTGRLRPMRGRVCFCLHRTQERPRSMTREAKTRRGQASRERIVASAADLVGERSVQGTSLDDVLATAGASKSQLYHYFRDKEDLVRAVVARQTE